MDNASNKSPEHTQKLTAELKKAFPKLSDQEIGLQATSLDKFYEAVKTKQGIERADAEKTVKKLDAECAAACSKKADNANAAPADKKAV